MNANIAHDRGFFVGNHPRDLTPQIERLREVLDRAAVAAGRVVVRCEPSSRRPDSSADSEDRNCAARPRHRRRRLHRLGARPRAARSRLPRHGRRQLHVRPGQPVGGVLPPELRAGPRRRRAITTRCGRWSRTPTSSFRWRRWSVRRCAIAIRWPRRRRTRTRSSGWSASSAATQRVVIPITNSGYGVGEAGKYCTEETPMRPVSLYGRDKVETERAVLERHPERHQPAAGHRVRHVAAHAARSAGERLHLPGVQRPVHRAVRGALQAQLHPRARRGARVPPRASTTSTR